MGSPWHTIVPLDVAAFSVDGGALPVRSENGTDSVRENTRLSIRVSAGTIWRGGYGEDCRCRQMRAGKLDNAWVKAVWVGRVDRSNEHLKGCIRSRVVRRIPEGNQAGYHAEVQGLPWDTLHGGAEMLRNATARPGEPPRPSRGRPRKDGSPAQARTTTTSRQEATRDDPMPGSSDDHLRQPTVEPDVIEQGIVIDTEASRVSDDRTDQGVLRMDQEEGITAEEQARRRLRSTQPAR